MVNASDPWGNKCSGGGGCDSGIANNSQGCSGGGGCDSGGGTVNGTGTGTVTVSGSGGGSGGSGGNDDGDDNSNSSGSDNGGEGCDHQNGGNGNGGTQTKPKEVQIAAGVTNGMPTPLQCKGSIGCGGNGHGHTTNDEHFGDFSIPLGETVDESHPATTPHGQVCDVDSCDFNSDGTADDPMSVDQTWPFGEKLPGSGTWPSIKIVPDSEGNPTIRPALPSNIKPQWPNWPSLPKN